MMKILPRNIRTTTIRLLAMAVVVALCGSQVSGAGLNREYSVKLAFLYKFANYVENSRMGDRDHVAIGVYGSDPFGATLDAVAASRRARGKTLKIVRFERLEDYQSCDILFVSGSISAPELRQLLERTQQDGVLVVGEQPQFMSHGGVMNFHIDASGKTAIQLNVDAAQSRDLRIDARLMRVCDIVNERTPQP